MDFEGASPHSCHQSRWCHSRIRVSEKSCDEVLFVEVRLSRVSMFENFLCCATQVYPAEPGHLAERPSSTQRFMVEGRFPAYSVPRLCKGVLCPLIPPVLRSDQDNRRSLKCVHRAVVFLQEFPGIGASSRLTSNPLYTEVHLLRHTARACAWSGVQVSDSASRSTGSPCAPCVCCLRPLCERNTNRLACFPC